MSLPVGTIAFDHIRGHACHCIGCCPKCGSCRTDPRHLKVCDQLAALNKERDRIWEQAS